MPLQTIWTLTTNGGRQPVAQHIFTIIFLAIIIGWIIIALWTRVLDNFTYGYLGLNQNSTWNSLLIALAVTIFFIVLIRTVDHFEIADAGGLATGPSLASQIEQAEDPLAGFGAADPLLTNVNIQQFLGSAQNVPLPAIFPGLIAR